MRHLVVLVVGVLILERRCVEGQGGRNDLVVVMHSGHPERRNYTQFAKDGWLRLVPNHVIVDALDTSRRRLMHVYYDDNPGCPQTPCPGGNSPDYLMIGKYFGAHRTIAGVLVANDTWPNTDWILVVDDDDAVDVQAVKNYLKPLDHRVPLLLAGRIGPGHNSIPCNTHNTNSSWSCCTDATIPCRAYLSGKQAQWKYSDSHKSFRPSPCPDHGVSNYCCRTKPWPQGINYGFPFRIDPDGPYRPHFSLLWPYGGLGYILSRGILDAISREYWQQCMYGLQCANADHRVMTCILNAGFSLTRHKGGIPGITHHIKLPASMSSSDLNTNRQQHPNNAHHPSPLLPHRRHHPPQQEPRPRRPLQNHHHHHQN